MAPIVYNINEWLELNKRYFEPPICNKLMYGDGEIKCFFVGGPNVRKDFHLEEGEEFFHQLKGDMNLIVVEQGKFKNVIIREGEVFLLPRHIPHSPQRFKDTCGMVIERERNDYELDGLRYYVENSSEILYEKWFHCDSLDSQLPVIIKEYFASEQYRTGKPIQGTLLEDKPVKQDFKRVVSPPFSLFEWIERNKETLKEKGKKSLFDSSFCSKIMVLAEGSHKEDETCPETFLWQINGSSTLINNSEEFKLNKGTTALLTAGSRWTLENEKDGFTLQVIMYH